MAETETTFRWWVRHAIVPILGSGALASVVATVVLSRVAAPETRVEAVSAAAQGDLPKPPQPQIRLVPMPLQPVSTNPAPAIAPPAREPETRAASTDPRAFVDSYFAAWSAPNDQALPRVAALYADEVVFFGKLRSRDDILREKAMIARRWPQRDYHQDADSLRSKCHDDGDCEISGVYRWRSLQADGVTPGAGTSTYVFHLSQGQIVEETGTVLSRN